ncbi:MAG TPA: helix-turn-helix domain-containing protein [Vicinamibacteria bacterium]|nr:helix-turn-helix domain-containing protein [Vicinamibacteria bacterium]
MPFTRRVRIGPFEIVSPIGKGGTGEVYRARDTTVALRRFAGLTQKELAEALGISVHTLSNWEQGRRSPDGPALALLGIAARHPRVLRENLAASA